MQKSPSPKPVVRPVPTPKHSPAAMASKGKPVAERRSPNAANFGSFLGAAP
ncbi:hypothetical protein [Parvularcula maris]|uniref:Uncharacterized protein n=1 Tax=Parvularcula maris TaxID=2965077 RepID=A0A9X2LA94_9PROT|nr:hypothetical protein [Parvularcula maris]MCQ8185991.1 hypothetical protein [Parvularcula maris]